MKQPDENSSAASDPTTDEKAGQPGDQVESPHGNLVAPTYTVEEALDEVCTQAFIVAHMLLQHSRSELEVMAAKALVRFILEDAKPLLADSMLPNICPECFTNLDDIGIAGTSEAHREHLNDEENEALNDALARSWLSSTQDGTT